MNALRATVLTSVLVAACAGWRVDTGERPDRGVPPPPAISDEKLHQRMHELAACVDRIRGLLGDPVAAPPTRLDQDEVVRQLDHMAQIATSLAAADVRAVHPLLGRHVEEFSRDLAIARRHASGDPPNFFMAGSIAGACAACHGGGFDKVGLVNQPTRAPR